jgi:hypothetical protein
MTPIHGVFMSVYQSRIRADMSRIRGNKNGDPKFDVAYDFVDGIAEVYFSEKVTSAAGPVTQTRHGYIDKRGRFIWRSE